MKRPSILHPVALLPFGLWIPTAAAQKSETEVQAEIEFARGLASKWSFVDLASEVLAELEGGEVSRSRAEELSLAKCEVFSVGARNEQDPVRRREIFEETLGLYSTFISENPQSVLASRAEAAFVENSAYYARALALDLEEAVGEEAESLRTRQSEVLEEAVKLTQSLIDGLKSIPPDDMTTVQKRELGELMLDRGDMLAEIGKSYGPDNGAFFFEQAISTLEDVVFFFGEGTPFALRAYDALGTVFANQKKWEDAAIFYQGVIDQAAPLELEQWNEVTKEEPPEATELRWLFVELSTDGLMEALINMGDYATLGKYSLHYYNLQRREGFEFSAEGHVSMLAVARGVLESNGYIGGDLAVGEGQWYATREEMEDAHAKRFRTTAVDFALRVADSVGKANQGNVLQVRAQKLMADVISRPGVEVSPETLLEAADGEYFERNFDAAVAGYRRVLQALDATDDATRRQFGARIMYQLGMCFRSLDRPLEAAMAFREGCTTWRPDPAYDDKNAQAFYSMIRSVDNGATTETDPLKQLVSEAESLVKEFGTRSADQVRWNTAQTLFDNDEFDQAVLEYEQIEEASDYYEKAIVGVGMCRVYQDQWDEAERIFKEYLETYVTDPSKSVTSSPARSARRKEAMALAEFFRGFMSYTQANESSDAAQHERTVELLTPYADRYGDQAKLAPQAMYFLVNSLLEIDKRDEARTVLELMVEDYTDSKSTGKASVSFYKALETAKEATDDAAEKQSILREMAEHLERANGLASKPSWNNLRNESVHWVDLGEWEKAEKVLRRIVDAFGEDPERQESVTLYARPDLGRVLLEQKRVEEAKAELTPLVKTQGARPFKATVLNWARSVTGWTEGTGLEIVEVPGAGGTPEEFDDIAGRIDSIAKGMDVEWGCEWYELKFRLFYTYYILGQQDGKALAKCKDLMANIENIADDPNWEQVDVKCNDEEETSPELREALGNQTLRQRFIWLKGKLR